MSREFYLSNTASDLSVPGDDFDNELVEVTSSANTITVEIAKGATETSYYFTEPGVPGTDGVDNQTGYSISLNVVTGSTEVNCSVQFARVNATGVLQFNSAQSDDNPTTLTAGFHTFSFSSPVSFDPWQSGDRLRVAFTFDNLAEHQSRSVEIGVNDGSSNVVTAFTEAAALVVPTQFIWT